MLFPESFFIHFSFKNTHEHLLFSPQPPLHVFFASSQSIGFCHSSSFCMFSWFNSLFSCCWYYSSNIRTKINLLNIFTLNVQWIDRRPNEFSKKLAWLKCKYDKINKVNKWNKQIYNYDIFAFQIVFFPLYSGTILKDLFSYNKQSLYSCYSDRIHLSTFTYSMQIQLCQDIC